MSSHYYLTDPKSESGSIPIPEEKVVKAILSITKRRGLTITDEMILAEVTKAGKKKTPASAKIYLYIDGTNLYASSYELFGPGKYLDFSKFIKEVERKLKAKFEKIFFYASYSPKPRKPTKKQKLYLKNEALFYRNVRKTKKVVFFKGYRSKTSGKEKEVDVKLSADILSSAFLDKFDSVYLLTGDADFLQVLFSIKKFLPQKKISLLCLENKIMYQGLFFFTPYIIYFKSRPKLRKKIRKVRFIKLDSEGLILKI